MYGLLQALPVTNYNATAAWAFEKVGAAIKIKIAICCCVYCSTRVRRNRGLIDILLLVP